MGGSIRDGSKKSSHPVYRPVNLAALAMPNEFQIGAVHARQAGAINHSRRRGLAATRSLK
jgi:hypothetical protein